MPKDKVNWEPDVRKGLDTVRSIKDLNQQLKDDADRRKIDGFNPGDVLNDSGGSAGKK